MNDEHSTSDIAGWSAGLFGLLLALVAWGREAWKHRHERKLKAQEQAEKTEEKRFDVTRDFLEHMLARIVALEEREKTEREEAKAREDTLRMRIAKVEEEADECQKKYLILSEQHRMLLRDHEDLREENDALRAEVQRLRNENAVLLKQNKALYDELSELYRRIGVQRTVSESMPSSDPKKK